MKYDDDDELLDVWMERGEKMIMLMEIVILFEDCYLFSLFPWNEEEWAREEIVIWVAIGERERVSLSSDEVLERESWYTACKWHFNYNWKRRRFSHLLQRERERQRFLLLDFLFWSFSNWIFPLLSSIIFFYSWDFYSFLSFSFKDIFPFIRFNFLPSFFYSFLIFSTTSFLLLSSLLSCLVCSTEKLRMLKQP